MEHGRRQRLHDGVPHAGAVRGPGQHPNTLDPNSNPPAPGKSRLDSACTTACRTPAPCAGLASSARSDAAAERSSCRGQVCAAARSSAAAVPPAPPCASAPSTCTTRAQSPACRAQQGSRYCPGAAKPYSQILKGRHALFVVRLPYSFLHETGGPVKENSLPLCCCSLPHATTGQDI